MVVPSCIYLALSFSLALAVPSSGISVYIAASRAADVAAAGVSPYGVLAVNRNLFAGADVIPILSPSALAFSPALVAPTLTPSSAKAIVSPKAAGEGVTRARLADTAAPGPLVEHAHEMARQLTGVAQGVLSQADRDTIDLVSKELGAYGREHGLKGLEGRVQRGLDPAGMLAVGETRTKLDQVARTLGANIAEVIAFTNDLHVGLIWKYAARLHDAADPVAQTWIIAGEATVSEKESRNGDFTEEEFLQDRARVIRELDVAARDPRGYFAKAHAHLIAHSREQFRLEEGVPISEVGNGFLAMAVNGYRSGIVTDKKGELLFVGADRLDFAGMAARRGWRVKQRMDRGKASIFYVDSQGIEVLKKVYDGLAIVLIGGSEGRVLAKEMARAATQLK